MQIREAYSSWASTYDTDVNLTRDLDQQVTRATLGHRRYRTILELGCGTGKNTALLAELGDEVQALDFSEGMLGQARAKLSAAHVTFSLADLTQPWPRADQSVELIVGNLVLEHINDLRFIFDEAARTLLPGGRCFISELHPFKQYQGRKAVFQRGDQRTEIDAFVHHISDFLGAAEAAGLRLISLREWWHQQDHDTPPRLVTLLFEK